MSADSKEVVTEFLPHLRIYKDGRVERLLGSPYVPPSLDDPITHVSSKDVTISSDVSARIFLPKITDPSEKLPVLVYFHGGGFCVESAFSSYGTRYLNQIVSKAQAIAVSVDYRLAPEHPLPAAYQDSWAALQWVASHAVEVKDSEIDNNKEPWLISHGDFDKLYLGGDSAGGNIAYNMAMKTGVESLVGGVKILGSFLCCPGFCDSETRRGSNEESGIYRMWKFVYPSAPGGIHNPLLNPFAEGGPELSGIGCRKLFLCCVERDELREINLRCIEALKKSGWDGELELVDVKGEGHCFQAFDPYTEQAQSLISRLASFIKG